MSKATPSRITSAISTMTVDSITVRGHDLARDMMGKMDAGELFYLLVTGNMPDPAQATLINAMIVSVAEHGLMPSVIAARLTLLGAPESLQGAVASGLLGVGDTFVGPAGNVARMLQEEAAGLECDDGERAQRIVARYFGEKKRIPGLGHPHHPVDPRTERLFALQQELGAPSRNAELMKVIHVEACRAGGRHLSINATAAIGSIASDIGIDWRAVRGIGLVARTIGLVGHLLEEIRNPAATAIWEAVQDQTDYTGPK